MRAGRPPRSRSLAPEMVRLLAAAPAAALAAASQVGSLVLAAPTSAQSAGESGESGEYRVYVANESSDLVSRVVFVPGQGLAVENEIRVGVMPGDNEGAHGIRVSPDGRHWYVTIAHGTPRGRLWKFDAGPDTLVGRTRLGLFPATMGITPDGRFLLAANFNLHGDMAPSDVSVVYTPDMIEVTRIRTCMMPHGSRLRRDGLKHYSVCMHSEQLVEIDVEAFAVSARFDLAPGMEGPLAIGAGDGGQAPGGAHGDGGGGMGRTPSESEAAGRAVCSPTWVEPGEGARADRFLYVACNRNAEVLEIDADRWAVTRRFPTGPGPYNLEATPDGETLLATLKSNQALAVFDLQAGGEIARVASSRPVTHGVVVSPDGRYAFVTNESAGSVPGTVDVIDLATLEVVGSIELAHQSGGIDFWNGDGGP